MISLNQLTDTQLILIYKENKDAQYFGALYNRYHKKVYHFCLGKLKNRDDAYDVTADTFLKIVDKLETLRNPELFISWLFRIAANACVDLFKARKKTRTITIENGIDFKDDVSGMSQAIIKEAQLQVLEAVLDQVDPETKQLLIDKYIKGKSLSTIEAEMRLNSSAVKMRLKRCRKKVSEIFNSTMELQQEDVYLFDKKI